MVKGTAQRSLKRRDTRENCRNFAHIAGLCDVCAFNKLWDYCFNEDIASEGAKAIMNLEAERDATQFTITTYTTEITQLCQTLSQNEAVLNEHKRGQRIAEATNKTQKLRGETTSFTQSDLADASKR